MLIGMRYTATWNRNTTEDDNVRSRSEVFTGRNSSLVVFGLAAHSVAGSILLWGHFPVEGIFPLELTWARTPFPKNSFGWEYKPRSSLCTHAFHHTDSKDPDVHVLDSECRQQKHTQHAPSTKTEYDYLNGWIKKRSHTQKSHPKMVNPRDIAGERRRRRSIHIALWCFSSWNMDRQL